MTKQAKMTTTEVKIISASRRTDIPAFYSEWLINRIREGWCLVPNPLNYNQLLFVSLKPENVAALVFWSKNPDPMIKYLTEIDNRGFRYYFQFTLNDYPGILEPRIPNINERIQTFQILSEKIGSERVIWRYDPIIISNYTPPEYHIEKFYKISSALERYTNRVMVSFVDYYQKTNHSLSRLEDPGIQFDKEVVDTQVAFELLKELHEIASARGIEIFTCAEDRDFSDTGVTPGGCIDGELLNKLWSLKGNYQKDKTQRKSCLCVSSRDIGINDTCPHGCPYCYSTRNIDLARNRYAEHHPNSPVIWGKTRELTEAEKAILTSRRLL